MPDATRSDPQSARYVETAADALYSELFHQIEERLDRSGREILVRFDEVVGERLVEAQGEAIQRLFRIWQQAAEGTIHHSLLP